MLLGWESDTSIWQKSGGNLNLGVGNSRSPPSVYETLTWSCRWSKSVRFWQVGIAPKPVHSGSSEIIHEQRVQACIAITDCFILVLVKR